MGIHSISIFSLYLWMLEQCPSHEPRLRVSSLPLHMHGPENYLATAVKVSLSLMGSGDVAVRTRFWWWWLVDDGGPCATPSPPTLAGNSHYVESAHALSNGFTNFLRVARHRDYKSYPDV